MGSYLLLKKSEFISNGEVILSIPNTVIGIPLAINNSFSPTNWRGTNITSYYDWFTSLVDDGKYLGYTGLYVTDSISYVSQAFFDVVRLYYPFADGTVSSGSSSLTRHYLDDTHYLEVSNYAIAGYDITLGNPTQIFQWYVSNPNFRPYTCVTPDGNYALTLSVLAPYSLSDDGKFISDSQIAYFSSYVSNISVYGLRERLTINNSFVSFVNQYGNFSSTPTPPTPGGDDPFSPGGTTGDDDTDPEGGTGDYDDESDEIEVPDPPATTAVQTGLFALYKMSYTEVQALGNYLWSDLFDLDSLKKLFSDPMGAILGLSLVPVVPSGGTQTNIIIGNIITNATGLRLNTQFVSKDFGTIDINEFWGAFLDYSPYTQIEIYLPFIGIKPLSIDDVMGKTLGLTYNIDIVTGGCVAFITVNDSVLYQFVGQCAMPVPVTANDWSNVVRGALSVAASIGAAVATGGLSAPLTGATVAGGMSAVASIASTAVSSKLRVEKSGSLAGAGGVMAVQTPYVIITRPRQALPADLPTFEGYPSYITRTLSSVSGFTVVAEIHLDGITATDAEKAEIKTLLERGVIF